MAVVCLPLFAFCLVYVATKQFIWPSSNRDETKSSISKNMATTGTDLSNKEVFAFAKEGEREKSTHSHGMRTEVKVHKSSKNDVTNVFTSSHVEHDPMILSPTASPPRTDFKGRTMYFSMGGESYIPQLTYFIESLVKLGIKEQNIGIICIDIGCTQHFSRTKQKLVIHEYTVKKIDGTRCLKNPKVTNTRCAVSMGKSDIILHHLRLGDALFFFDADVLFYEHPYDSMQVRNTKLNLYVQTDDHEGRSFNFGTFLAYPSDYTIRLFQYIRNTFDKTQEWDQTLFNKWLQASLRSGERSFEVLDHTKYLATEAGLPTSKGSMGSKHKNVTLVHSTCLEGSATKWYATICHFGSLHASHYTEQRTVTVDAEIGSNMGKDEEIDIIMRGLVRVAKASGRAIRVPVSMKDRIDDPMQPYAIVSTDYLQSLGVQVVEPQYWQRAKEWHNRDHNVFRANFTLKSIGLISEQGGNEFTDFDEIQFQMKDIALIRKESLSGNWSRSFACNRFPRISCFNKTVEDKFCDCINVCDANHF